MEVIHIVLGKANPNRMNGVNNVVYQLVKKQHESGKKVSLWGITADQVHNYGERSFETRLFQQYSKPFVMDDQLRIALLEKKGEITVHLHGGWIPVFATIASFLKQHDIPFIFTPHGAYNTIAMRKNWLVKKIYFRFFERKVLEYAKTIHCIGRSELLGLEKIYPSKKTVLLPYGFEPTVSGLQWQPKKNTFTVGFVGRIDIYTKGLDLLVEGFYHFQQHVPAAQLWIIGDGEQKVKLIEYAIRKGFSKNIIFFGGKFGDEKEALIKQMNVFAHPSRNEGLPSSVLEALSNGIPCIVSEATNLGSYVSAFNAGIVIKSESIEAIKDALLASYQLWDDGAIYKMKKNAEDLVGNCFNWNILIDEFQALYTK